MRVRAIVFEVVVALCVFLADPLGLAEQEHRAIDSWFAVATQYLHSPSPRNLAVVLIDRETLDGWRLDWPVTYTKTADIIRSLACAHALGVFFDWTLTRRFNLAEGDVDLRRAIVDSSAGGEACPDGAVPARIPVFFGKIDGVESQLGTVLEERNPGFLLSTGEADSLYQAGREEFPNAYLNDSEVTPAFGLIRAVPALQGAAAPPAQTGPCAPGDTRPRCWTAPLALVWNAEIDPAQAEVSDVLHCRGNPGLPRLLWGQLPALATRERYETCPPVLTLRAADLTRDLAYVEAHGNPTNALAKRFVLVGADLLGLNDQIATPVHEHLPGVYKHAVALATLINYGPNYPTEPPPLIKVMFVALVYLTVETLRELSRERAARWVWAGAALSIVLGTGGIIYWLRWPMSLVAAIFVYYEGTVGVFFVAARAKSRDTVG